MVMDFLCLAGVDELNQGMTLVYKLLSSSQSHSIRIPFDPPLSKYDDAKPRLLSMKAQALGVLGTVRVRK
jgi:hypothetical protein